MFIPMPWRELDAVVEQGDSAIISQSRGKSFFGPGQSRGCTQIVVRVGQVGQFATISTKMVIRAPIGLAIDVLFGFELAAPIVSLGQPKTATSSNVVDDGIAVEVYRPGERFPEPDVD